MKLKGVQTEEGAIHVNLKSNGFSWTPSVLPCVSITPHFSYSAGTLDPSPCISSCMFYACCNNGQILSNSWSATSLVKGWLMLRTSFGLLYATLLPVSYIISQALPSVPRLWHSFYLGACLATSLLAFLLYVEIIFLGVGWRESGRCSCIPDGVEDLSHCFSSDV